MRSDRRCHYLQTAEKKSSNSAIQHRPLVVTSHYYIHLVEIGYSKIEEFYQYKQMGREEKREILKVNFFL